MEELHFNCSSVGIHHMSGQMTPYECTAKHVFKDAKDVNTFLGEVVEICKVFGYSNILYTISNESCKYLTTFVKENAKEILSFKSKRSSNKITYYSQLI